MATIVVTTNNATVFVGNDDTVRIDIAGGGTVNIVADPNSTVKEFEIKFIGDTQADTANINLATFSQNDLKIDIKKYDPTDRIVLKGSTNKAIDPNKTDRFNFNYTGANGNNFNGYVRARDDGQKDLTQNPQPIIICFTPGSMITTPLGQVPVEDLQVGDLVITADNGLQAIRWIGRRRMTGARLMAYPDLRPVRIRKGAFGDNLPERDLWVSPQHRILVSSNRTLLDHGESEVLVPAKGMLNDHSVIVDYNIRSTEYLHILFDQHEIIFANGIATESFHPGSTAIPGIEENSRKELFEIFPELQFDPSTYGPSARLSIRPQEARLIKLAEAGNLSPGF